MDLVAIRGGMVKPKVRPGVDFAKSRTTPGSAESAMAFFAVPWGELLGAPLFSLEPSKRSLLLRLLPAPPTELVVMPSTAIVSFCGNFQERLGADDKNVSKLVKSLP